jgi:hypothetical protein
MNGGHRTAASRVAAGLSVLEEYGVKILRKREETMTAVVQTNSEQRITKRETIAMSPKPVAAVSSPATDHFVPILFHATSPAQHLRLSKLHQGI